MSAIDHLGDPQFTTIKQEIDAQIAKRGTDASRHPERPEVLYHGTAAALNHGDVIRPGHDSNWPDLTLDTEAKHVFATGDITEGYHFGMHAAHRRDDEGGDYGPIPSPHIYEVHPMGRLTYDAETKEKGVTPAESGGTSYQSRQPMRVGHEISKLAKREWHASMGQEWEPRGG